MIKKSLLITALLASFVIAKAFDLEQKSPLKSAPEQNTKRISIMTYNVENLFDTKDDPEKDDETYLPLLKKNKHVQKKCRQARQAKWAKECLKTNWTQTKLKMKMKRLAQVIKSYKKDGPDVLILQEVENISVLKDLNKKFLGYPHVFLEEGPDKRGIDVGILSRLKNKSSSRLHLQKLKAKKGYPKAKVKATRGILEVTFQLPDDKSLTVFGLHFPSQGSPTEARRQALERLKSISEKTAGLKIAAGDFNITQSEDKREKLYTKLLSQDWLVSHLIGCKDCKGSNYYHRKREWSFLDAILFSKNFNNTWKVDPESIQVWNKLEVQKNHYGSPKKFYGGEQRSGVSDHFPLVAEIFKE